MYKGESFTDYPSSYTACILYDFALLMYFYELFFSSGFVLICALILKSFFAPMHNLPDNPLQKCSRLHRVMQTAAMRDANGCYEECNCLHFFHRFADTGLPCPYSEKNANFATLTRPFLPFQTGGQFLYKPMNNMTEKQLKTEKQ